LDVARPLEPLKRKDCDGGTEQLVDVNGDGLADLRHVFDGSRRVCDEIDLNFDGHIDLTRIFGKDGQVALEQYDLDFDGRLDQQSFYEGGKLVRATHAKLMANAEALLDQPSRVSEDWRARILEDEVFHMTYTRKQLARLTPRNRL
jgi:hypothetical protein